MKTKAEDQNEYIRLIVGLSGGGEGIEMYLFSTYIMQETKGIEYKKFDGVEGQEEEYFNVDTTLDRDELDYYQFKGGIQNLGLFLEIAHVLNDL